jgi:hypothetical protein
MRIEAELGVDIFKDDLSSNVDNTEYNHLLDVMLSDLENMNKSDGDNVSFNNELNNIINVSTINELEILPTIKNVGKFSDGAYYSNDDIVDVIEHSSGNIITTEIISSNDNDNNFSTSLGIKIYFILFLNNLT